MNHTTHGTIPGHRRIVSRVLDAMPHLSRTDASVISRELVSRYGACALHVSWSQLRAIELEYIV